MANDVRSSFPRKNRKKKEYISVFRGQDKSGRGDLDRGLSEHGMDWKGRYAYPNGSPANFSFTLFASAPYKVILGPWAEKRKGIDRWSNGNAIQLARPKKEGRRKGSLRSLVRVPRIRNGRGKGEKVREGIRVGTLKGGRSGAHTSTPIKVTRIGMVVTVVLAETVIAVSHTTQKNDEDSVYIGYSNPLPPSKLPPLFRLRLQM